MSGTAERPVRDPGQRAYASYLLRIWRLDRAGREIWRLALIDPHGGVEHRFTGLDELMRFLADPSSPPPAAGGQAER